MKVDTLSIAQRLQAVGASKAFAEEQAQIMQEVVEEHLVTKPDLRELELRMRLYNGTLAATLILILAALNVLSWGDAVFRRRMVLLRRIYRVFTPSGATPVVQQRWFLS